MISYRARYLIFCIDSLERVYELGTADSIERAKMFGGNMRDLRNGSPIYIEDRELGTIQQIEAGK